MHAHTQDYEKNKKSFLPHNYVVCSSRLVPAHICRLPEGKRYQHAVLHPLTANAALPNYPSTAETLSKLSWRDHKRGRKGIHLTENGSNKRHVILMGVNARAHYQMPV